MVSGDTLILFLSKYVANFYHELHIFVSYIWFLGLALLPNILSTSGRKKKKKCGKNERGNQTDRKVSCHSGLVFNDFFFFLWLS